MAFEPFNFNVVINIQGKTGLDSLNGSMSKTNISSKQLQATLKKLGHTEAELAQFSKFSADTQKRLSSRIMQAAAAAEIGKTAFAKYNVGVVQSQWAVGELIRKLNALRWSVVNVAFAVTSIVLPFAMAAKMGTEFGMKIARVGVLTQQTGKVIVRTLEDIRKGTIFSIDDMVDAYTEFIKLGFSESEAESSLKAISDLATVGFTDLKTATEVTGQVMHQFNIPAEQATRIVDVLAKGANMSAAEVETFGEALAYAGGVAQMAGISFEETSAIIATLTNAGMSGSRAGTSLAAAIRQMVNPTDKVKKLMYDIGASFFSSAGEMKDFDTIVTELSGSLAVYSQKAQLAFLTETFGARGGRAMFTLISQYRLTGESLDDLVDKMNNATSAAETMGDINETAAARATVVWKEWASTLTESVSGAFNFITLGLDKIFGMSSEEAARNFANIGDDYISPEQKIQLKKIKFEDLPEVFKDFNKYKDDLMRQDPIKFFFDDAYNKNVFANAFDSAVTDKLADYRDVKISSVGIDTLKARFKELEETYESAKTQFKDDITVDVEGNFGSQVDNLKSKIVELETQRLSADGMVDEDAKEKVKEITEEIVTLSDGIINTGATIKSFNSDIKELQSIFDKTVLTEYQFAMAEAANTVDEFNRKADETGGYTATQREEFERATYAAIELSFALREAKSAQSVFQKGVSLLTSRFRDGLNSIRDNIKNLQNDLKDLSTTSLPGQWLAQTGLIEQETAIKRQRLAVLELGESVENVSDILKRESDDYKDWVKTIETYVREQLLAGKDLGISTTTAVKEWQTKLMGFTMSSRDKSGKSPEEEKLDEMQRKYQINSLEFELAFTDKQSALKRYEEELTKNSAVESMTFEARMAAMRNNISSMKNWESEEAVIQGYLDDTQDKLREVNNELAFLETGYDVFTMSIVENAQTAIDWLDDMADSAVNAARKVADATGEDYKGSDYERSTSSDIGSRVRIGTRTYIKTGEGEYTNPDYKPTSSAIGGFVQQAGLALVHPGELIRPAKIQQPYNGGMEGNISVTFGDINIGGGANATSGDLQYEFAETIRRELARIK